MLKMMRCRVVIMRNKVLLLSRLKELLEWDGSITRFKWKVSRQRCKAGAIAGGLHKYTGYRQIRIDIK